MMAAISASTIHIIFVHRMLYEVGFITAVGYDYYSVASGYGISSLTEQYEPLNDGSFDLGFGFRLKYFCRPNAYVGIAVKYNCINYCNQGGSDLRGNAISIDFSYGSH